MHPKIKPFILSFLGAIAIFSQAQAQFIDAKIELEPLIYTAVSFADFDQDGDLDLLLNGQNAQDKSFTNIYRNNNGGFALETYNLPQVDIGSVAFGDFDQDGDQDVLITGWYGATGIYRNDGAKFSKIDFDLEKLQWSSAVWCDFDQDGYLDFAINGKASNGAYIAKIYRNNRQNKTFDDIEAGIIGVAFGSLAFGDYDQDGDQDLLQTGITKGNKSISVIYRNDHQMFTMSDNELVGAGYGKGVFVDYDQDGDLDIFIAKSIRSLLYKNEKGVFTDSNIPFIGVIKSSVDWGDYDQDGDLDLAICGYVSSKNVVTKIYKNNNGAFIETPNAMVGVQLGVVHWVDYDNDADLDLFVSGEDSQGVPTTKIYKNGFEALSFELTNTQLDSSDYASLRAQMPAPPNYKKELWADFDGDQDLDLATVQNAQVTMYINEAGNFVEPNLRGVYYQVSLADFDQDGDPDVAYTANNSPAKIYRNDNGKLTKLPIDLGVLQLGTLFWSDYQNDGDIDLLVAKPDMRGIVKILVNQPAGSQNKFVANQKPQMPTNLKVKADKNTALFSWSRATDDISPEIALQYNLYLYKKDSVKTNILTTFADNQTSRRFLNEPGNVGTANSLELKNLSPGDYFWSVQTIDQHFSTSNFAPVNTFKITQNRNCVVSNTNNSGDGSLRDAIWCANQNKNIDTIRFDISGIPPYIIRLNEELPSLRSMVVIDASTQPNFRKDQIEIDASILAVATENSFGAKPEDKLRSAGVNFVNFPTNIITQAEYEQQQSQEKSKTNKRNLAGSGSRQNEKPDLNPLLINLTDAYLGLNTAILRHPLQGAFGLSFYYPLGFFVSGYQTKNDPMPTNRYNTRQVKATFDRLDDLAISYPTPLLIGQQAKSRSIDYGIYVNALPHLYLKFGYSSLAGSFWDLYSGSFSPTYFKNNINPNEYVFNYEEIKTGNFLFGAAVVFPYLQAEVAYNQLYNNVSLSLGVNYPIRNVNDLWKAKTK